MVHWGTAAMAETALEAGAAMAPAAERRERRTVEACILVVLGLFGGYVRVGCGRVFEKIC